MQIQTSRVKTTKGMITVVRDDLLQGGTKQRAAIPFLQHFIKTGIREFIYASPFSGYAQVALAYSCQAVGAKCTLFAERYEGGVSEFTNLVSNLCTVRLADNLTQAEIDSSWYESEQSNCMKIPLGFNHPLFKQYLKFELKTQWDCLCNSLDFVPKKLWVSVGSGTLANTLKEVISKETALCVVDVGVLEDTDSRILDVKKIAEYSVASEPFHSPAERVPPIPSNKYYDAKLWSFVDRMASDEDVWWNVAK